MTHHVLISPYIDTSEGAYARYDELRAKEDRGTLTVESPEYEEFSVLRVLLRQNPGTTVLFEEEFKDLLPYATSPLTEPMRRRHDRTVEAWEKVRRMIDTR